MTIQGSKPYATYTIKMASTEEALKLRLEIETEFKASKLTWFKHYFLTTVGSTVNVEIYTAEADELLREVTPQYLL